MSGVSSVAERGRDDDRDHQRQDDAVVAGQLEDDQHGGDRGARGGGEHGAHPDQAVGAGGGRQMPGTRSCGDRAVGAAEHRAHEQRRREDAARAADPDRQARREDLRRQQAEQDARIDVVAGDRVLEHRVADAVHLGTASSSSPSRTPPAAGRSHSGPRQSRSATSSPP